MELNILITFYVSCTFPFSSWSVGEVDPRAETLCPISAHYSRGDQIRWFKYLYQYLQMLSVKTLHFFHINSLNTKRSVYIYMYIFNGKRRIKRFHYHFFCLNVSVFKWGWLDRLQLLKTLKIKKKETRHVLSTLL